jgi:hypothetical protein
MKKAVIADETESDGKTLACLCCGALSNPLLLITSGKVSWFWHPRRGLPIRFVPSVDVLILTPGWIATILRRHNSQLDLLDITSSKRVG